MRSRQSSDETQLPRFRATRIQPALRIGNERAGQLQRTQAVWRVLGRREVGGPLSVIPIPEHDLFRVGIGHGNHARKLLTGGPIAASLRRRLTIRQIGAGFSRTAHLGTYQTLAVLPDDYDVIIWFREAGPTRLLRD